VTLSATLSVTSPASGTLTGNVTFKDGSTTLGTGSVTSGQATLATSSLAVGSHTITAVYGGDSSFNTSTSSAATVKVTKGATTLAARAAPATVKAGSAVTLTAKATVTSPASATPSGAVTFRDSGVKIGTATLSAGVAHLQATLPIGSHMITASYPGDSSVTGNSATTSFTVSAGLGSENKVNTTTAGVQQAPAVAALKSGYVVVWESQGQDGSGYGIYGQRYSANGVKLGTTDMPISTTQVGNQTLPSVTGLTGGSFVVVWQSGAQDGNGTGIIARIFSAHGAGGAEFKVNTTTRGAQTQPAVAALADGGFVVAWTSNGQDGSGLGVYAQRYDAKAKPVGVELKVNKTTAGNQSDPAVTGLTGGGFVVAWQGPDASGLGIYMQRYDAASKVAGRETAVATTTLDDQSLPTIAALDNGGFVVAWQSALQDGSGLGVYMRRYTSSGARSGGETRVNTTTVHDQSTPSVAAFSNGGFIVAWTSNLQDGSGQGVYAQAFTDAGAKANVEFRVNTTTAGHQNQPAAAAFASGSCIVVWASANDGSAQGIYSQRFAVPGTN
jgi:hypothetical protein